MLTCRVTVAAVLACLSASPLVRGTPAHQSAPLAPVSIHPDNPHYFLWRGKPTVLIGSGEHYGALINLDFDYRTYFDTLAAEGMMLTRLFSGSYVEPQGAFNIARNTLRHHLRGSFHPGREAASPGMRMVAIDSTSRDGTRRTSSG